MSKPEEFTIIIGADYDSGLATDISLPTHKAIALHYDVGGIVWVNGQPYKITGYTDRADGVRKCSLRLAEKLPAWVDAAEVYH